MKSNSQNIRQSLLAQFQLGKFSAPGLKQIELSPLKEQLFRLIELTLPELLPHPTLAPPLLSPIRFKLSQIPEDKMRQAMSTALSVLSKLLESPESGAIDTTAIDEEAQKLIA